MSEVAIPSEATVSRTRGAAGALDHSLLHGLAWTGTAKWGTQLLSWASTFVVARLLTPEDYGLVGMAAIYLGLVTLLSEFGLGAAVVIFRDLSLAQISQLNGLSLLFGLGSFLASCAMAVPLGHFFRAPQLPLVVVAMSSTFLITGFKTVPYALLSRDLRFKALALIDMSQALVLAVGMIGFALAGFRYWTLVLGGVLGALISAGAILKLRHPPFAWPRLKSLRQAMALSYHVIVSRLSWYAYSNADFLVAGRILGKAALGVYEFGWTLANTPVDKVTALVGQVTGPLLSVVQTEHSALRRYLVRITEGIALVTFPVSLGLALVAKDFVLLALGPRWEGTIAPLQLLAAYAGLRSITPLLAQVLVTIKDSKFVMWNSIASAIVMPVSFYYAGTRWGTVGLGAAWVLVYPLIAAGFFWRVFRKIDLPATEYFIALWPAVSGTALMAAVVLTVGALSSARWSPGWRLTTQVASGVVTYGLACLVLHGERLKAFYTVVRAARRGPESAPLLSGIGPSSDMNASR